MESCWRASAYDSSACLPPSRIIFTNNNKMPLSRSWLQNIALTIFYAVHLYYFYGVILWERGGQVYAKCVGFWICRHQISRPSPSWLSEYFGISYHPDLSDHQWREFRESLSLLAMVAIVTSSLSWLCRLALNSNDVKQKIEERKGDQKEASSTQPVPLSSSAVYWNTILRLIVGMIAIVIQHGLHSMIVFTLCLIGFGLIRLLTPPSTAISISTRHRYFRIWIAKVVTWIYAICVLLFKESYRIKLWPGMQFLHIFFDRRYGGMYVWQLPANFLVLRLISFCFDYLEAFERHCQYEESKKTDAVVHPPVDLHNTNNKTELTIDEKTNITKNLEDDDNSLHNMSHPWSEYNLLSFMTYMTYAPLYMAGPIVSFNSFLSSSKYPQQKVNIYLYGLRWILCFSLLEWMTSRFPFFAIVSTGLLPHLSIPQIATVFYLLLKMMWLKFLTIWRFFRWWSLTDGIYTIENQQRCMSNNYSLTQFWKGWHTSFNKWLVRYLYKPLGGRRFQYLNVWVIFFFVALWHDVEWKLIVWGGLNGIFYVIEVFIIQPIRERLLKTMNDSEVTILKKVVCHCVVAGMGALFIMILISVNLIGYGVGTGAIDLIVNKAMSKDGIYTCIVSFYFLSIGVSLMLFIQSLRS
jgi:D-alanyl-lipoteichoic acid acyltransferase DltB (MBOAT superfamily)